MGAHKELNTNKISFYPPGLRSSNFYTAQDQEGKSLYATNAMQKLEPHFE